MANRPVHRGYPVPFFVAWINGEPDFRIVDPTKLELCLKFSFCWLCGKPLGKHRAMVIGPMCSLNHITSEPPSHVVCATYALETCPHMINPGAKYREANRPAGAIEPAGQPIYDNPGTQLLWQSSSYKQIKVHNGFLIDIGEAEHVEWWTLGRPASRDEASAALGIAAGKLYRNLDEHRGEMTEDELWQERRRISDEATKMLAWLPNE